MESESEFEPFCVVRDLSAPTPTGLELLTFRVQVGFWYCFLNHCILYVPRQLSTHLGSRTQ